MIASRATWLVLGALFVAVPTLAQVPDPEFAKMPARAASDSVSQDFAPATLPPMEPQSLVQPYGTWRMQPPPVLFGASTVLDPAHNRIVAACGSNGYLQKDVWTLSLVPGSTWQIDSVASAQSPGPLAYAATVYDAGHARMIMFGGLGYPATPTNQVWSLSMGDPMVWSPVPTQGISPPARWSAVAAYDSRRNRLIVYGGEDGHSFKSDAWALSLGDTARWERLAPADSIPTGRSEAAGVYDSINDRLLVYGGLIVGEKGYVQPSRDLLSLSLGDTVAWRTIVPSGRDRPYGALSAAAYFDPAANRMLLLGGERNGPLPWELDLDGVPTWTPLFSAVEPLYRQRFTALYDSGAGRLLITGGTESVLDESGVDVLSLSGTLTWSALGLHPRAPGRSHAITLFDSRRDRMILFGGSVSGPDNDTWAMSLTNLDTWTRLSSSYSPRVFFADATGAYDSRGDRCFLFTLTGDYDAGFRSQVLVLPLADTSATWQELQTTGEPPPPREGPAMVYDPVRNRLLVFGGRARNLNFYRDLLYDEVWSLSLEGTPHWTKLEILGPGPTPRDGAWAFYDALHDRLLIHGGYSEGHTPGFRHYYLAFPYLGSSTDDWWSLSLGGQPVWKKLVPQGSGPSLRGESIAYDSRHNRLLVSGGARSYNQYNASTWGLNLEPDLRWEYLLTSGDPATGRTDGSSLYDPVGDRLVVFGGDGLVNLKNDVWALEFSPGSSPAAWIVRSSVEGGTVKLVWGCRDGIGTTATVYRKTEGTPWASVTSVQADATGEISFTDTPPADHWRQTYRIGVTQGGATTYSPPVNVEVQQTRQPLLVGAYPNPSRAEDFQVRFQLPSPAAARLEMIDVRGRVVWASDVTASSPGIETLRLPAQKRSGVYLLRLLQDGKAATLKAVVLE